MRFHMSATDDTYKHWQDIAEQLGLPAEPAPPPANVAEPEPRAAPPQPTEPAPLSVEDRREFVPNAASEKEPRRKAVETEALGGREEGSALGGRPPRR